MTGAPEAASVAHIGTGAGTAAERQPLVNGVTAAEAARRAITMEVYGKAGPLEVGMACTVPLAVVCRHCILIMHSALQVYVETDYSDGIFLLELTADKITPELLGDQLGLDSKSLVYRPSAGRPSLCRARSVVTPSGSGWLRCGRALLMSDKSATCNPW